MRLEHLDHVGVVVDSLDRAGALFGGVLGLTLDEQVERDDLRAAFFTCGNARVELIEVLDDEARERRLGDGLARIEHIAFEIDDLDVTMEVLQALGIEFMAPPRISGRFRTVFTAAETTGGIMMQFSQRLD